MDPSLVAVDQNILQQNKYAMVVHSKKPVSYLGLVCKHHSGFILGNKGFCLWELHDSS